MHPNRSALSRIGVPVDRRRLLQGAALGGAGLLLARSPMARAQEGALSGEITIGYEGAAIGVIPYIEATATGDRGSEPRCDRHAPAITGRELRHPGDSAAQ